MRFYSNINPKLGTEIENPDGIHGFKAFYPDWACRPAFGVVKQYTCPGMFETETDPSVCGHGMHFCRRLEDIFNYYSAMIKTVDGRKVRPKVAEVIAWGKVITSGDKCSTNKLEIVREILWEEVVARTNLGCDCSGVCNTGDGNTGSWNTGDRNVGDCNTGNNNIDDKNTGNYNTGRRNTGNCNTGNYNAGDHNVGDCNTGSCNTGNYNAGDHNVGDCNIGCWNMGNWNAGEFNCTSFVTGCFCTEEPKILMFNKPSGMTYNQWKKHPARNLLYNIPRNDMAWVDECNMSEEEKEQYPTYKTTGGYLKILDESECAQRWWDDLNWNKKEIILQLPNFDADIFYQCTGIRV